ncbi:MAG: SPASM domain-containing protein [Clostridia bacterium]|nr:SPASM domain-containing protein [Clostridia bacterium]
MPKPKKRFAKIYLEITNLCNMSCSFCHGTKREAGVVSPDDFKLFCNRAAPFTDHVYLHVMGEPLLHPQLGELIDTAAAEGLKVSITTNGTLLPKALPLLLSKAEKLYKISISLHSFEANSGIDAKKYFDGCFDAAKQLGKAGVISALRLWNLEGLSESSPQNTMNGDILDRLKEFFTDEWTKNRSGQKIGDGVYLEWGERFDWPDMDAADKGTHGFCYALKDHVAVLCDGSVVPCCLDADGVITLGNLKEQELGEILANEKTKLLLHGFENHSLCHPLCRRCGFARKW